MMERHILPSKCPIDGESIHVAGNAVDGHMPVLIDVPSGITHDATVVLDIAVEVAPRNDWPEIVIQARTVGEAKRESAVKSWAVSFIVKRERDSSRSLIVFGLTSMICEVLLSRDLDVLKVGE
jgi:hypothetical protein